MSTHDRESLLAAYLLGELDAQERAAFERALAGDAELRAEVEALRPVVARLGALPEEAWEDEPAPPLRLPDDALVDPAPASEAGARRRARPGGAADGGGRSWWWSAPLVLRPGFAALAAAALLAGGIALGVLLGDDDGAPSPRPGVQAQRTLPLEPIGTAGSAQGTALVAAAGRPAVTLRLRGLPPSRAGELYELWLMDADGPLVSLGSFRAGAGGRVTVRVPLPVPATRYQYFDVSVEREGGDPSHSGDSILRGATRA